LNTLVETKMSGVEIFKMFESDLSRLWYAFLRHLESYYCILRWKNWIGSFYKKFFWGGKKLLSLWHPQWVDRVTWTTLFFWGLMNVVVQYHRCRPQAEWTKKLHILVINSGLPTLPYFQEYFGQKYWKMARFSW
jgi:hypothetical protein